MANAVEIESKVLIDEKEYAHLEKKYEFGPSIEQTNWYIDSDDRILEKSTENLRLRIRFSNGEYRLSLKAPLGEGLLDKEELLSPSEAEGMISKNVFPEGAVKDFLSDFLDVDVTKLKTLAKMVTVRRTAFVDGVRIDIDKNTYGDVTDYELEADSDSIETSKKAIKAILKGKKVVFNEKSKQARAMAALAKSCCDCCEKK